jgi:hypothetical protein
MTCWRVDWSVAGEVEYGVNKVSPLSVLILCGFFFGGVEVVFGFEF